MPIVTVQIIAAPIACKDGVKDTWRETAAWAAGQLRQHFGETVQLQYFDLFDPACPTLPDGAQLPLILVNGELLSSGGKISLPSIRCKIETILEKQNA